MSYCPKHGRFYQGQHDPGCPMCAAEQAERSQQDKQPEQKKAA